MTKAFLTYEAALFPGEDSSVSRKWMGQAASYAEPVTANSQYYVGPCYLLGCVVTQTTAPVKFFDGTANTVGSLKYTLPSSQPSDGNKYVHGIGIPFNTGIYVEFQDGTPGNVVPLIVGS